MTTYLIEFDKNFDKEQLNGSAGKDLIIKSLNDNTIDDFTGIDITDITDIGNNVIKNMDIIHILNKNDDDNKIIIPRSSALLNYGLFIKYYKKNLIIYLKNNSYKKFESIVKKELILFQELDNKIETPIIPTIIDYNKTDHDINKLYSLKINNNILELHYNKKYIKDFITKNNEKNNSNGDYYKIPLNFGFLLPLNRCIVTQETDNFYSYSLIDSNYIKELFALVFIKDKTILDDKNDSNNKIHLLNFIFYNNNNYLNDSLTIINKDNIKQITKHDGFGSTNNKK